MDLGTPGPASTREGLCRILHLHTAGPHLGSEARVVSLPTAVQMAHQAQAAAGRNLEDVTLTGQARELPVTWSSQRPGLGTGVGMAIRSKCGHSGDRT